MATSQEKRELILALSVILVVISFIKSIFSMSLRWVNIVLYSLKFANCKVERKSVVLISKTSSFVHIDFKMFDFEVPVQSEIKLSFSSILTANRLSFISCLLFGTLIKLFWRRMAFQRLNCLKMFIYNFTLYAQLSSWAWIIKFQLSVRSILLNCVKYKKFPFLIWFILKLKGTQISFGKDSLNCVYPLKYQIPAIIS